MKFAEHLSAHITPEWRKQYIQYEVSFFQKKPFYSLIFIFLAYERNVIRCHRFNTDRMSRT